MKRILPFLLGVTLAVSISTLTMDAVKVNSPPAAYSSVSFPADANTGLVNVMVACGTVFLAVTGAVALKR